MPTAIINAKVFDGFNLTDAKAVVIEGGLISAKETGDQIIDAAGCTLMPALIDCHIHIKEKEDLGSMARSGIATALDMGSRSNELVDSMKNLPGMPSILSSYMPAFASGSALMRSMGFPSQTEIVDRDAAISFVREQVGYGADYIKVILEEPGLNGGVAFQPEMLAAITGEAHRLDKKAVAHAVTPGTFMLAASCGIDIITHIPFVMPLPEQAIAEIAEGGIVSIPTMVTMKGIVDNIKRAIPQAPMDFNFVKNSVDLLYKAGVRILTGTDSNADPTAPFQAVFGASIFEELELLAQAGLTPIEALKSATSQPASYFGLSDRGAVAPGKRADLLLVEGDPTVRISDIRNIRGVWINGERVAGL